jgi:hypothetical protein
LPVTICRELSAVIDSSSYVPSSRSPASDRYALNGTISNSGTFRIVKYPISMNGPLGA